MSRVAWAALGCGALLLTARIGVAPPEECPTVRSIDAASTIAAAVGWLADGQAPDGQFTYSTDEAGNDLGGYNVVRHAGVVLSLEQATTAGVVRAAATADRGREWALDRLVPAHGGLALPELDGHGRTGASALFVRGLLERRDARGASPDEDEALAALGRFLAGQVLADGAVSSRWDPELDANVPSERDIFFTGQVLWALDGLDRAGLADDDVRAATARVSSFLPRRDDSEDRFPPVSDHWGAYAYDGLGLDRLTEPQLAHAERLVGIIGVQVRGESTRWRGGLIGTLRGGIASGSGLGTLGEGGAALLRLLGEDGAPGMTERVRCTAGMLVERQADDGAWYRDGITRMDDQQHAISALLGATPLLDGPGEPVGGGEQRHRAVWLLLVGVVAAVPVSRRRPHPALVGAALLTAGLVALLSGPVLDALEVSPASARAAAGVAVAVAALSVLAAPRAGATTGVLLAAGALLALAVGTDDGAAAMLAAGVAGAIALALPERWRGAIGARVVAVMALLLAADLVIDGVMGV